VSRSSKRGTFVEWWATNEPRDKFLDDWTHADIRELCLAAYAAGAVDAIVGVAPALPLLRDADRCAECGEPAAHHTEESARQHREAINEYERRRATDPEAGSWWPPSRFDPDWRPRSPRSTGLVSDWQASYWRTDNWERLCEECAPNPDPDEREYARAQTDEYHVHCECCGRAMYEHGAPMGVAAGHTMPVCGQAQVVPKGNLS
jgi:hypothetical protein